MATYNRLHIPIFQGSYGRKIEYHRKMIIKQTFLQEWRIIEMHLSQVSSAREKQFLNIKLEFFSAGIKSFKIRIVLGCYCYIYTL